MKFDKAQANQALARLIATGWFNRANAIRAAALLILFIVFAQFTAELRGALFLTVIVGPALLWLQHYLSRPVEGTPAAAGLPASATRSARPARPEPESYSVSVGPGTRTNHLLHLVLSIITFGLWVPIWIIVTLVHLLGGGQRTVTEHYRREG